MVTYGLATSTGWYGSAPFSNSSTVRPFPWPIRAVWSGTVSRREAWNVPSSSTTVPARRRASLISTSSSAPSQRRTVPGGIGEESAAAT